MMKWKTFLALMIPLFFGGCSDFIVDEGLLADLEEVLQEHIDYGEYTPIEDINDLKGINNSLDGKYILISDISISSSTGGDDSWVPIGSSTTPFTGEFDGGGYIIYDLTTTDSSVDQMGLFGVIGSGAQVRRVSMKNGSVVGGNSVGSLAGVNYGSVENCYNTGDVSGNSQVGGLIGYCGSSATVMYCFSNGSVSGISTDVGGIIGYSDAFDDDGSGEPLVGLVKLSGASSPDNSYGYEYDDYELSNRDNFTSLGWDFSNTWAMGSSYPYLRK